MTPVFISLNPGAAPAFAVPVELVGPTRRVSVRLALRWHARIARWALQMTTPDRSVALSLEQLVAPGGDLLFDRRDTRAPEGRLTWTGPDGYRKTDLGRTLRLVFVPSEAA